MGFNTLSLPPIPQPACLNLSVIILSIYNTDKFAEFELKMWYMFCMYYELYWLSDQQTNY